jgi:hypothetical protein
MLGDGSTLFLLPELEAGRLGERRLFGVECQSA